MGGTSNSESNKGARWPEARAMLGWWVRSWVRPAGDSLDWEQRAGRETPSGTGVPHGRRTLGDGGSAGPGRHQNIKQTGAGT